MVAVAVDGGRRDEAFEGGEELEGREGEDSAAVAGGPRGVVENLADRGLAGGGRGAALSDREPVRRGVTLGAHALEGEGRPGRITAAPQAPT